MLCGVRAEVGCFLLESRLSTALEPDRLAASLGCHALFRCADDADETCLRVGQVFRPHRMGVLGRSQRLAAQMDHMRLARMSLNRLSYGASVSIASDPMNEFVMVFIPLTGTISIQCGHQHVESTPTQAAVVSATHPLQMHWRSDADVFILRVERSAIEESCAEQLGHRISEPIDFDLAIDPARAGFAGLQALLGFLATNSDFANHAATQPTMAAHLEHLVASSLLLGHRHNYAEALLHTERDSAPAFVRKAEDLMVRHLGTPLSVDELASRVGVSSRTLQDAFRRYRASTPLSKMRALRLDAVRQEMLNSVREARPLTVSEVAGAFGFSHMGHFSRAYLERFNELPSATLKQL